MTHTITQCGNGSSRLAQGKAAATKALNGGGSAATAEAAMIASAEARGATTEAIAKLQEGFAARLGAVQVATAQSAVDAARATVNKKQAQLDTLSRTLRSADDFAKANQLRDELAANRRALTAAEKNLESTRKAAGTGREQFTPGKAIADTEMRRTVTAQERQLLGDRYQLKDPRQFSRDEAKQQAQARIREYESAKKAAPGLSQSEFLAIQNYTKGGYVGMNGAARGLQTNGRSPDAQRQRIEARLVHQALDKAPKFAGEVRRDTQIPTKDFQRDYQVGNVVRFNGVTSTTSDLSGRVTKQYGDQKAPDSSRGYTSKESVKAGSYDSNAAKQGIKVLPKSAATQVEYRIQSKSGRNISSISRASAESEVALQHGWQGRINKVESYKNSSGQTVQRVFMQEV